MITCRASVRLSSRSPSAPYAAEAGFAFPLTLRGKQTDPGGVNWGVEFSVRRGESAAVFEREILRLAERDFESLSKGESRDG